ncbi:hypothetical protein [Catenuloplanes atrovinosus]|uniref:Uncharacterized protein n=1 Tax=Catenuloplanes atrovinosus TaxID=137266 RepID=A0AAE3YNR4_9ACTN|nr:hypothetical protein [Catenuloplanes atrovinosus]MDR7277189.1 hypothetical protein [Catenuloplanes atrovinosus]
MAQTVPVRVGAVEVLLEAVSVPGSQQTSAGGRVADYAAGAFERAQVVLEEVAVSMGRIVGRVGSPELVKEEFGVKESVPAVGRVEAAS